MTNKGKDKSKPTPEDMQHILDSMDWQDYSRRVVEEVSKRAQAYKEADAKSLEGASRQVFV